VVRKTSPTLTEGELRLMNVLWTRGPSTVVEVQDALEDDLVDSTIRTLLKVLEDKGYVERLKEGRAFRYHARVGREETRASVVDYVVTRFFKTPADLMLKLIDTTELDEAELERIQRAMQLRRSKGKGDQ
jgi:BlaI family penicillinase repressor